MREVQHFKVIIDDNEIKTERDWCYKNYQNQLKHITSTCGSKCSSGDIYDKKTGIVVSILKTLGYSRRFLNKIIILLAEEAAKNKGGN